MKKTNLSFISAVTKLCSVLLLVALILAVAVVPASAAETLSNSPYATYTYWDGYGSKQAVEIKATHEVIHVFEGNDFGVGEFVEMQHTFAYKDNLYILDSGNSRIIILDKDYKVVGQIDSFKLGDETITFKGAKGLFMDESGLYVADTLNKRVLCTNNGVVTKVIERPDDTAIPATYDFAPIRLVKDSSGYYYLLCEGSYYGMMVFSDEFEFFGFFGADSVKTSFADAISEFIKGLFETETKHNASLKQLPYSLLDICIDHEGFIVAINSQTSGQVKRYGLVGTNTLKKTSGYQAASTDSYNFADNPAVFPDKTPAAKQGYLYTSLTSIVADDKGYYYAMDGAHGKIIMMDTKCNTLSIFGNGRGQGKQDGTFITPSSLSIFNGDIVATDFVTNKVTVFRVTDYGKTYMTANAYTVNSDYTEAKPYWEQIHAVDKNNQLAYRGLAKAALKEEKYNLALEYAEKGMDQKTYALAFAEVRNEFIANNFWWISIIALVVIGGAVAFLVISKKKQIVVIKADKLRIALTAFYHPFDNFNAIKYKNMGSIPIATALLALYYVSSILITLKGGFMFGIVDTSSFNAILTLLGTTGVVVVWVVANWLVSILFEGKGKMKEIYCATCSCLVPMIIYNFAYVILSHVLIGGASSPFSLFSTICYVLTALLLLLSIMVIHDFTFFKSIFIALAIILGMAIVVFVLFVILTLWQDLLAFVIGLFNEVTFR